MSNWSRFTRVTLAALVTACTSSPVEQTAQSRQRVVDIHQALGFESVAHWSRSSGPLALSSRAVQGSYSLAVQGGGYSEIRSVALPTLPSVGSSLSFKLLLPVQQPNPYWYGSVQAYVDIPSQGVYGAYIGQRDLTGLPLDSFIQIDLPLGTALRQALQQSFTDLVIRLVLNAPGGDGTYLFDALSFDPSAGSGGSGGSGGGAGGTGGSTGGASGTGGLPSGAAVATGAFDNVAPPLTNAVSVHRTGTVKQRTIVVSNLGASCALMQGGRDKAGSWVLELSILSVPGPNGVSLDIPAGTHGVGAQDFGSGRKHVVAHLFNDDSQCRNTLRGSKAESGEIVLTQVQPNLVEGTFSLVFPDQRGTLTGAFSAPDCPLPAAGESMPPTTCEP